MIQKNVQSYKKILPSALKKVMNVEHGLCRMESNVINDINQNLINALEFLYSFTEGIIKDCRRLAIISYCGLWNFVVDVISKEKH